MAQTAPKGKRIRTKEEIARNPKGNIPEFEFFLSDGSSVSVLMKNRGGRVWINGALHESFYDLWKRREAAIFALTGGTKEFQVDRLYDLIAVKGDEPDPTADGTEDEPARLYRTAEEKRNEFFAENQAEILACAERLVSAAVNGVASFAANPAGRINREYYYEALRMILDVDDETIPEELRAEVQADHTSEVYQDQNFEDVREFVDSFRKRVGL